jgi:hypothetical protein
LGDVVNTPSFRRRNSKFNHGLHGQREEFLTANHTNHTKKGNKTKRNTDYTKKNTDSADLLIFAHFFLNMIRVISSICVIRGSSSPFYSSVVSVWSAVNS